MNKSALLYWTPRALGLAYAVYISLFALDVFAEGYSFLETTAALLIHLIPTYVSIAVLAVAWKWERVGAGLYMIFGLAYVLLTWDKQWPLAWLAVSGPLAVIGTLFWVHAVKRIK